jgi:hypothetical protein
MHLLQFPYKSNFSIRLNGDLEEMKNSIFSDSQDAISKNTDFTLSILRPKNEVAKKNAIIFLHGLNERSWDKYMPWAYSLAEQTGKSVILFPIAYHMNRSPEEWNNPRQMTAYVDDRLKSVPGLHESSYLNVALSERITSQPQRFFLSGYQAAQDIINLMDDIKNGTHPLFEENTKIDFFAYSIGVLLSEVLLLANPGKRFSDSRFFFFCGGSVLEGMHGESKYILDNKAFNKLFSFYNKQLDEEFKKAGIFSDLLSQTNLGRAFINFTSFSRLNKISKKFIRKIKDQVYTVCLKNDKVMPPDQIKRTLAGTNVQELDFPYPYTHEVPFPLRCKKIDKVIDKAFADVFNQAGAFLGG